MCEQHQGLAAREVKKISAAVPGLGHGGPAEIADIASEAKVGAGRISSGIILPPAVALVGRTRSGSGVVDVKPVDAPALGVEMDKAPTSPEKIGDGVKKDVLATVAEDSKKPALLALLTKIDTMQRNNTIPGKKQSERQLWITTQLADQLGVIIPMNSERNFGKSEGFRRNIFDRIKRAAKTIIGPEYSDAMFPDFMK